MAMKANIKKNTSYNPNVKTHVVSFYVTETELMNIDFARKKYEQEHKLHNISRSEYIRTILTGAK